MADLTCKADLHGLCSVENERRKAWVLEHANTCSKAGNEEDFVMTAGHIICLRPSAVGDSASVLCDCGAKADISHWEHT